MLCSTHKCNTSIFYTSIEPKQQLKFNPKNSKSNSFILTIIDESQAELNAEYESEHYLFDLDEEISNNENIATLIIVDKSTNTQVYNHQLEINRSTEDYRTQIRQGLENDAQEFDNGLMLNLSQLANISAFLQDFSNDLFLNVSNSIKHEEIVQSIFYHNSILKIIYRKISGESNSFTCATSTKYLNGLSSFTCNEDIKYSGEQILHYYSTKYDSASYADSLFLDTIGVDTVIDFANDNLYSIITLKQIEDTMFHNSLDSLIVYDSVPNSYLFGRCAKKYENRGETGCSGADKGKVCRICNFVCRWHDLQCCFCEHWWCIKACIPDGCGCTCDE